MNFKELLEGIDYTCLAGDVARHAPSRVITAPSEGGEDAVYVALRTPLRDGHADASVACAMGCRLFVCERDIYVDEDATVIRVSDTSRVLSPLAAEIYGHPERALTLIGITGSDGKSSVAWMLEHVLAACGRRVGSITTDGVRMGGVLRHAAPIVPNGADISRILAEMCANGVEIAIIEYSAYQLAHGAAEGLSFLATALTNLRVRHIGKGEFADLVSYRAAKERLLSAPAAFRILPADAELSVGGKPLYYGTAETLWAEDVHASYLANGMPARRLLLCEGEERVPVLLPVCTDMGVENALLAATLARVVGLSLVEIGAALGGAAVPARMECIAAHSGAFVYLDSAFEAESVQNALRVLEPLVRGRLSVLLGSVGGRSVERRARLGAAACAFADYVYLTADDADAEDPRAICEQMRAACSEPERTVIIPDRRKAILRAIAELRAGDVLLILCRGAGEYQLDKGVRVPFSEREIVREALAKRI